MTRRVLWASVFCLTCFSAGFGQQAQRTNVVQGLTNTLSIGAGFSYYSPKLTSVNSAFDALEDTLGLPRAPQFKIYYLAETNLRYAFTPRHSLSLEFAFSLSKSGVAESETFERVYSLGAQYYYSFNNRRRNFYGLDAGLGASWLITNLQRNYNDQRISILKKLPAFDASVIGWVSPFQPLSFEVEARYMFVPNTTIAYPQATLKMSSVVLGAGISIAL